MKHLLFGIFSYFLLSPFLFTQPPSLESPAFGSYFQDNAHIPKVTGQIINASPSQLQEITVQYTRVLPGNSNQREHRTFPSENGSFELHIEHAFPYQQIWLRIGDLYYGEIMAHDSLDIIFDLAKIGTDKAQFSHKAISYGGPDAELNHIINKFIDFERDRQLEISGKEFPIMIDRGTAPPDKMKQINEIYHELYEILDAFLEQNPNPHANLLRDELKSQFYGTFLFIFMGQEAPPEMLKSALEHQPRCISNNANSYYRHLGFNLFKIMEGFTNKDIKSAMKMMTPEYLPQDSLNKFIHLTESEDSLDRITLERIRKYWIENENKLVKQARWKNLLDINKNLPGNKMDLAKLYQVPTEIAQQGPYFEFMIPTIKSAWLKQYMSALRKKTT